MSTDDRIGLVSHTREELREVSVRALTTRGAPEALAEVQVDHLLEAELRGHPSHGLRRMATLAARIDNGLIDPTAHPTLTWQTPTALRCDGNRGFGPVAAYAAIEALAARVAEFGIVAAALSHTHHLGMLAPYVDRLAADGLIGIVLSSTEGLVHPWGGSGALLGTNPLGIGIPADGGDLSLDMSTGAVSAGKILDYKARGLALPDGWAVDADGHPTTDAAAAADGAISPFGGAKGYAIGLALGALVGAMTGTALGPDVFGTLDAQHDTTKGDVIIVIDPTVFAGGNTSGSVGAYFDLIRNSGVDGRAVTVPGDRARAARATAWDSPLSIPEDVWHRLLALADHTG